MNRDFIRMQPVSKSEMVCISCGHLFDANFRVCTCIDPTGMTEEMLEELGRHPVRRVVPYKQYVVDKFGGKKGEVHEDVGQGE